MNKWRVNINSYIRYLYCNLHALQYLYYILIINTIFSHLSCVLFLFHNSLDFFSIFVMILNLTQICLALTIRTFFLLLKNERKDSLIFDYRYSLSLPAMDFSLSDLSLNMGLEAPLLNIVLFV